MLCLLDAGQRPAEGDCATQVLFLPASRSTPLDERLVAHAPGQSPTNLVLAPNARQAEFVLIRLVPTATFIDRGFSHDLVHEDVVSGSWDLFKQLALKGQGDQRRVGAGVFE